MEGFTNTVNSFFSAIQNETNIKLNKSPLPLTIKDDEGTFQAYYAFYKSGAIRVEVNGEDIIGISVWNKPGNLNKPDYHCRLKDIDPMGEIDIVALLMRGKQSLLGSDSLFEDAKTDVEKFMGDIGGGAYNKRLTDLYVSYEQWAEIHAKKRLSNGYFFSLAKEWLIRNKQGKYADFEITKGTQGEKTEVNSGQEDEFEKEVMENQIYYKAALLEHAVRRIAQDDPLINALFLCGSPGIGKSFTVKKVLQSEGIWDDKVVWKSGSIAGFTGLLQVLWENRKKRILVLDDCDNLLVKKDQSSINILKAALNTEQEDRIISYVRMKKKEDK
jgi:hypothetical protein